MPQQPPASDSKILVLDDDEIILIALAETLRHDGFASTTTQSPNEALEILRKEKFAVIISDQRMAEMTGLEFLQQAAKIQPTASRILITGVLTLKTVIDAINTGEIFRFVAKPWLREDLIATIRNAVQRHQLLEDNATLVASTMSLNAQLSEANNLLQQKIDELTRQKDEIAKAREMLRNNFENSLELMQRIVSAYHPMLGDETRVITDLCEKMSALCDMDKDSRHVLRLAARLKNMGLIGVSRELFNKARENPDKLNENERNLIEESYISSQMLASEIDPSGKASEVIRSSRERWDGKGFPDGLKGETIPLAARILAISAFYAESAKAEGDRIEDIFAQSGTAFSSEDVMLFMRAIKETPSDKRFRQIAFSELRPGMILAKGIFSSSGMLLLPEGHALTDALLERVKRQNADVYSNQKFFVYF
jgi:response regulator RpfG family c-di-GMP phosphodiesterase